MTFRSKVPFARDNPRHAPLLLVVPTLTLASLCCVNFARAQVGVIPPNDQAVSHLLQWKPPLKNEVAKGLLFTQLEDRTDRYDSELRWDGEAWIGTDMSRLWLKSEGTLKDGSMSDGDHELLYDRPVPRLPYFDAQLGIREDLDSGPHRTWGAVGVEGLAPQFVQLECTFYFRDAAHVAGKVATAYDVRITKNIIAQSQVELNFYSRADPARHLGTGLGDLDTGLRLRYMTRRKLDPYLGFTYTSEFGSTAAYSRRAGEAFSHSAFVLGLRAWR